MIEPGQRRRYRAVALGLGICALLVMLAQLEAQDASRNAWTASWVRQAEELGVFAENAVASGNELMLVQRLANMVRRDDVAYVVILDQEGVARFAGDPANAGKKFTGPYSKRAMAATCVIVQKIHERGVTEVDVPTGRMVIRCGFTLQHLAAVNDWLWAAMAVAVAGLGGACLLLLRIS